MVVRPNGVVPTKGEKAIGPTNGVVGNVTLRPGGNNPVDPAGFSDEFRAACSSSMNCIVGDSLVVFVTLLPGTNVKFLPVLCIVTVPAGKVGLTSFTVGRGRLAEPVNGPPIIVVVDEVKGTLLTRAGVMGIILGKTGDIPGFPIPIRTIGGRANAGATKPNKLKQAKTKISVRPRNVRMTPLL